MAFEFLAYLKPGKLIVVAIINVLGSASVKAISMKTINEINRPNIIFYYLLKNIFVIYLCDK